MNKIYIVWCKDPEKDHPSIAGVFISKENADAERAMLSKQFNATYRVEKRSIDDA